MFIYALLAQLFAANSIAPLSSTTANTVFTMGQHTSNTLAKHSHLQTCLKYDLNRDYVLQEDKTLTEGLVETAKDQKRHKLLHSS